jgi:hypothetical protein
MAATDFGTITVTAKKTANYAISNLRAKLGTPARPNNFSVKINLAKINSKDIDDTFQFRCEKAELPGKTIATSEGGASGPAIKLGYDMTYNDIQLSIICAQDMKERIFFESWMDYIVKPFGDRLGAAGTIAYYSDYALGNKLTVSQLNDFGESILTYECMDVYPIALTPMNATWDEVNTYQRFGVTLAYRYHAFV